MTIFLATPLQGPVALNLPFSVRSAGEVRRTLTSWLVHQDASETVIYDARLIATELISNAIRHAVPLANDTMLVRWHREDDALLISVCDGGGSGDPVLVVAQPDSEGGRGLAIIDALSLRWWVQRNNKVHTVHVRLPMS